MFTVIRATFRGEEVPKRGSFWKTWAVRSVLCLTPVFHAYVLYQQMIAAPYIAWIICIVATAWVSDRLS